MKMMMMTMMMMMTLFVVGNGRAMLARCIREQNAFEELFVDCVAFFC